MLSATRRAVLFDLDGVVRLWPQDDAAIEQAAGLPLGAIRQAAFAPDLLRPAITGPIADDEWRRQLWRGCGATILTPTRNGRCNAGRRRRAK